ncbi:MAG: hypothetical protein JWM53_4785 [bacterium]|nr:hypothetical protein [bacterium]
MPPEHRNSDDDNRAPVLGSWRRWYVVVLGTLAALIALFAFLSAHYQ